MENLNDPKYLEKTKIKLIENLRSVQVRTLASAAASYPPNACGAACAHPGSQGAPGVSMNEIPPDTYLGSDDEDEEDPDARISGTPPC
jgi:hypothetical protein